MNRILFFAEGQLGDSLVLMPALRAVRKTLPHIWITVLLFYRSKYFKQDSDSLIKKSECRGAAEVFANNPYVDEVLELDRKALRSLRGIKRLKAELKCISYLRKNKYDAAICTFPQDRFALWAYLAGIKIRIGQRKQSFSFLLTHKADADERSDEGVLKYFCRLLEPLGIKCTNFSPYYEIPQDAKDRTQEFFKNFDKKIIAIHPGARDKDRQWPPAKYSELINCLSERNSYNVLLCYGDYDVPYIDEIKKNLRNQIVITKTDSISQLAAIFQRSNLCIVHSSGPRHLAAAAGAATLGLVDKHDHIMWKIYDDKTHHIIQSEEPCPTCKENDCLGIMPPGASYGALCMQAIKVKDVLEKIESILD